MIVILISSFPMSLMLFVYMETAFPGLALSRDWLFLETVNFLYYFPVIVIPYMIFFRLLKIDGMNRFFTYTTFSRFYSRYREPETTVTAMRQRIDSDTE